MEEYNMAPNEDIDQMEFEEALKELEDIVKTIEEGKSSLRESVDLYERGTMLKKRCDTILESIQLRINQISCDKDGIVSQSEMEL
ncbi:MAG: exodeoxyribonuclease VII small subunit [Holosporaceae bacterium]|jgi:exodeoxyribonuclease VII small subunit|nr:exodeoxyribonuclease VII small subunit [Holosporaceae bacterium]